MAKTFLAALGMVLHVRVTKANDPLPFLSLTGRRTFCFARCLLRLVVATKDFAGVADLLFAHDFSGSGCSNTCLSSGLGVLDLVVDGLALRLASSCRQSPCALPLSSSPGSFWQAAARSAFLSCSIGHEAPPLQTEGTAPRAWRSSSHERGLEFRKIFFVIASPSLRPWPLLCMPPSGPLPGTCRSQSRQQEEL